MFLRIAACLFNSLDVLDVLKRLVSLIELIFWHDIVPAEHLVKHQVELGIRSHCRVTWEV